jgi:hypothetical protein
VGLASGLNNAVSRTAGLLAIALLTPVVTYTFNAGLDARLAALRLPPESRHLVDRERVKLAGAEVPQSEPQHVAIERAVDEAFVASFRLVMLLAALLALASAVGAAATLKGVDAGQKA